MELRYSLTVDDHVTFQEHVATTFPLIRRQQRQLRVLGTVSCPVLAAVLVGVVLSDWVAAAVAGVVAATAVWFLTPTIHRRVVRRSVRTMVAEGGSGPVGPVRLCVDDTGLTEEIGGTTTTVTWAGVHRVDESARHLYVFTAPAAAIIVPKGAPGSAGLATMLRARTGPALR